jgi:hypothetical protein
VRIALPRRIALLTARRADSRRCLYFPRQIERNEMKAILLTAAIVVGISSLATSAAFAVPVDASFTSNKVNLTPIE